MARQTDEALAAWLLCSGGPVIRYRTTAELMRSTALLDISPLHKQLLECPLVRLWLGRLTDVRKIHDSGNDRFENEMESI